MNFKDLESSQAWCIQKVEAGGSLRRFQGQPNLHSETPSNKIEKCKGLRWEGKNRKRGAGRRK